MGKRHESLGVLSVFHNSYKLLDRVLLGYHNKGNLSYYFN